MREIAVHLEDSRGPSGKGNPKSCEIGRPNALFRRPAKESDTVVACGDLVDDRSGPIGGAVIDNQDVAVER